MMRHYVIPEILVEWIGEEDLIRTSVQQEASGEGVFMSFDELFR